MLALSLKNCHNSKAYIGIPMEDVKVDTDSEESEKTFCSLVDIFKYNFIFKEEILK